jgi:tetratricopeptide (TPR) repeat protein
MDFYQRNNANVTRRFPQFPKQPSVLFMLIFFIICTGILIVPPVTALDAENQTLVDNLLNKGDNCFTTRDYSCTLTAYEAAHQVDPGNGYILLWHGQYLSYFGNNTAALEKMDAALALNPEYAQIWYEKGKVLDKLGRYFESGACYDRAEALDPEYRVPLTDRFPLNVLIRNATVIVVACGFFLLAIYIYFNERRRQ